ncbi:hypothetical protein P154DRAFT_582986 [Amniculicola lignicola CBS 123094]|uniref:Peptidase metallopeptidase domain-containing protein n=1 Tax=Amniculicola lignicola CBS 123094 TaxID=1392246 RepID=A0A6A5W6L2_9PLEO|nr:hypothetical protein P154DRAFT_582986 [Amniculicola lignicola CBS 123094]
MASQKTTFEFQLRPTKVILPELVDFRSDAEGISLATTKVMKYLKSFGYATEDAPEDAPSLSKALKSFQQLGSLTVTGIFDQATKTLMETPRCGRVDNVKEETTAEGGMQVFFVPWPNKFDKTEITYRFEQFTPDMTPSKIRRAVSDGFSCWAAITPLSFREVSKGEDVLIHFTPRPGTGNTLANAGPPPGSYMTFYEDEDWLDSSKLAAVALHEIGHVIGLDHTSVPNSTMNPIFSFSYFELHPDDIHGAHFKYGWREPKWVNISGADPNVRSILSSSNMFFKLTNDGHVWQYTDPSTTGWKEIGNSQGTMQIVCENKKLYAFTVFGAVMQWTGTGSSWTTIDVNSKCVQVLVGGGQVYQRHFDAARNYAAIYRFAGMGTVPRWELIDDNPQTRQIDVFGTGPLYQRHDNGSLWRYVGPGIKWELISDHNGATLIAAGPGEALFFSDRPGNIIRYRRVGTVEQMQTISAAPSPTMNLLARGEHLVQLRADKSLWRFTGETFKGWEQLDGFRGTVEVTLSETGDVYQRHADGAIWRLAV